MTDDRISREAMQIADGLNTGVISTTQAARRITALCAQAVSMNGNYPVLEKHLRELQNTNNILSADNFAKALVISQVRELVRYPSEQPADVGQPEHDALATAAQQCLPREGEAWSRDMFMAGRIIKERINNLATTPPAETQQQIAARIAAGGMAAVDEEIRECRPERRVAERRVEKDPIRRRARRFGADRRKAP